MAAKTHDGVHALIAQHFVLSGTLPPGTSRLLKHLEGDREIADYDLATPVSDAEAAATIAEAEQYVNDASALLSPG